MEKAREAVEAANVNYYAVLNEAQIQWKIVKDSFFGMDFWQWVIGKYAPLSDADNARKATSVELYEAMNVYHGPDAAYPAQIVNGLGRTTSSKALSPGYNQDGLIDDADLINRIFEYAKKGEKIPDGDLVQSTIRVPQYTLSGYTSTVIQSWIDASSRGASRDQVITIDIDQGRTTKWEDLGFKEVSGNGAGLWPFLSAEVRVGDQWESRILNTSGRENDIALQLAMVGVQKFDIETGGWNIPNVKTRFPDRIPDAPDALSPKVARILSVLAAYDIELKVNFASGIRNEVDKTYEEVKSTGGRMSVFGFHVSAGADNGSDNGSNEYIETKFEDVKWDEASGSMTLTAVKGQFYPTILGAVAHRFD
ncbi:hypothetical protein D9757_011708 [Collybiopsis confluens]|uniref:Uncharacterized protein n=1 Tax=Collybiopsis confluens TaxID=2823264 RepID=A0A8H5LMY0_9AGAR|nr:hypothetical protein D9757_011708 [Collybiopsis confluens]